MFPGPCMPKPMPAMTMRFEGATAPLLPRAAALTIVGNPATPAAAAPPVIAAALRNCLRFIFLRFSLIAHSFVSLVFSQISGVLPGTATGSTGFGPNSYFAGERSSFEAFMAQSQLIARPV